MGTPAVVPTIENPEDEAAQGRSTIKFPYLDQSDAVEIAKAVHDTAGNSCDRDALAAHLNVSSKGGGFNLRLLTAKLFGFITSESGTVSLTPLGIRVIDPQQEKAARAESFLLVPLYRRVFDDYRGNMLPANPALEAAMEKMGVAPKQKDKARQVFQRSANQAGFFAVGNNRLVAPQVRTTEAKPAVDSDDQASGSKGGIAPPPPPPPQGPELPPHVKFLVDKLPEEGTVWGMTGRRKWLEGALKIFDLAYEADSADAGDITISLASPKTSAN